MKRVRRMANGFTWSRARPSGSRASRLATKVLVVLSCLAIPACRRAAEAGKSGEPPLKTAQKLGVLAKGEDTLVQQAASNFQQRIQEAAREHTANAKLLQEIG